MNSSRPTSFGGNKCSGIAGRHERDENPAQHSADDSRARPVGLHPHFIPGSLPSAKTMWLMAKTRYTAVFIVAFVSCAIVIVADPVLEDCLLCIGLAEEN
jgi:hypothetical protein